MTESGTHPQESTTTGIVAARLTPRGRGAVATIAIRGGIEVIDHFFRPRSGVSMGRHPINRISVGEWGAAGEQPEELVLCRVDVETTEVHCHGGGAAVGRILKHLESAGAKIVSAGEFQSIGKALVEVECMTALTRATTSRSVELLLEQSHRFPRALRALRDVPERDRLRAVDDLLYWSGFGVHLTVPWKVVLCGRPNVGKSSLINRIVGYQRAVVFEQPGTTRDVLTAPTAIAGWPVELIDTAGQRPTSDVLEAEGMARARQVLAEADLVVLVVETPSGWSEVEEELIQLAPDAVVVWNKIDLASEIAVPPGATAVSAQRGDGVPQLIERIAHRLVPQPPPAEAAYPVTAEQQARLNSLRSVCADDARWEQLLDEWIEKPD